MRLAQVLFNKVGDLTKQFSNLPESYIKRSMEQVYYKTPKGIQYQKKTIKRRKFLFTTHRPWTGEFYQENYPGKLNPKVFVEPIRDWNFFRGDRVQVLEGKDKGKQGIIVQVFQERNWVIVEGLNTKLKTIWETKNMPAVVVKEEKPLLVTTGVALVDPSDLEPTKIQWRYTEEGERVRVSERTGRIIPMPKLAEETYDYKTKATYKESEKDTKTQEHGEITFSPSLATFEMDIMNKMGIKENREQAISYWY